ncbi:MAG: glycosyltransferase family 9 protein [Candidatus Latescibacter sp.]|nr:glycosyltransferase family 9 protein [Candidatus Latescibacter sp.]
MNILLIRTGGLGDCILTLPVGSYIKRLYPEARLHVLGNATMLAVSRLTGEFSGFRSVDEAGFSALFSGSGATGFLCDYFSEFDRVYFFTAGNTDTLRQTVLETGAMACRILDPRPPQGFRNHITEHLLSILETPPDFSPGLPPLSQTISALRDGTILVIHPGSGGVSKMWPLERFIEIACLWPDPKRVVFILGPAEIERGLQDRIPAQYTKALPETIQNAFHVLAGASLYLGNDSGVSHLAALAGTPSVVLFGPSDPVVFRPLGSRVRVLFSPDGHMERIGAEEVMREIELMIILRRDAKKEKLDRINMINKILKNNTIIL